MRRLFAAVALMLLIPSSASAKDEAPEALQDVLKVNAALGRQLEKEMAKTATLQMQLSTLRERDAPDPYLGQLERTQAEL